MFNNISAICARKGSSFELKLFLGFTANGDPLCDDNTCSKQPGENHKIFQTLNVLVLAEKSEKIGK